MHLDGKTYDKPWDDTGFIWSKNELMTIFADKASPASCPEWERSPWCTSESPAGVRVSQQRVLGGSGMLGVWGNALGGNVGSSYNQNLLKTDEVWRKLANGLKTLNIEYIYMELYGNISGAWSDTQNNMTRLKQQTAEIKVYVKESLESRFLPLNFHNWTSTNPNIIIYSKLLHLRIHYPKQLITWIVSSPSIPEFLRDQWSPWDQCSRSAVAHHLGPQSFCRNEEIERLEVWHISPTV